MPQRGGERYYRQMPKKALIQKKTFKLKWRRRKELTAKWRHWLLCNLVPDDKKVTYAPIALAFQFVPGKGLNWFGIPAEEIPEGSKVEVTITILTPEESTK